MAAGKATGTGAGAAFGRALARHPDRDWFYPDFDFFGQDGHYITERAYDLLFHARINLCEAGSLIRRRVLDAGLRFDETMKQGYEDWDFWLQAAGAGFVGRHLIARLRADLARMEENAEGWRDEAMSLHEQLATALGGQPGINQSGALVVVPMERCA